MSHWLTSVVAKIKKLGRGKSAPRARRRPRLELESLEDRLVLSTTITQLPTLNVFAGYTSRSMARSDSGTVVRVSQTDFGLSYSLFNSSGGEWATGLVPNTDDSRDSQVTVAMGNNGNFVVAWSHVFSNSSYDIDVRAQVFNAKGNAVGGTLWVASSDNVEDQPAAGMDQGGNFVVAYRYAYSSSDHDIYAMTYNTNGQRIGTAAVATSTDDQRAPSVAMNRYGQYVVAFDDTTRGGYQWVGERTYNINDQALGSASISGAYTSSAAIDAYGDVGVAYTYRSGGFQQVGVQRYNLAGQSEGFTHAGWGGENQYEPSIGMADDGRFVVAYKDDYWGQTSIYAEAYSDVGTELSWTNVGNGSSGLGAQYRIGSQYIDEITVGMDASGDFAIDYLVSYIPAGSCGVTYQQGTLYRF